MKQLVLKDNFAYLYLNVNFYSTEKILNTLVVYKEFFKPSTSELGKYFVVKIEKLDENFSLEELAREFLNYLISKEYEK
jgi:hypothetical protein